MTAETLELANKIQEKISYCERLINFIDANQIHLIKRKYFLFSQTPLDGHYEMELDGNDALHLILRNEDKLKALKYLLRTLTDDNFNDYFIDFKNIDEIGTSKRLLDIIEEEKKNAT